VGKIDQKGEERIGLSQTEARNIAKGEGTYQPTHTFDNHEDGAF